ncbi:MAG: hypothetical protein L6Q71_03905 [Planctomycetes bacterium]|nr:hypothetical protein [Planctomycetota bacterium]NUQ34356.1 hypothetical protein [Planctomycetaceae bacterium]
MRTTVIGIMLASAIGGCSLLGVDDEREPEPFPAPTNISGSGIESNVPPTLPPASGPDLAVLPYDENSTVVPWPEDAELTIEPFDPDSVVTGGPFADLPPQQAGDTPVVDMGGTNPAGDAPAVVDVHPADPEVDETSALMRASLTQMIAELERRRGEEGGNTVENAKALLALYLAHGVSADAKYAEAAAKLMQHLRERPDFSDKDWLTLQTAEFNRQTGEAGASASDLKAAYHAALKYVPLEVTTLYHSTGNFNSTTDEYEMVMMTDPSGERRENTVVKPGATFYIAFRFRFLNSGAKEGENRYSYSIKIVPELTADENGEAVRGFNGQPYEKAFSAGAPDQYVPGHLKYALPVDIKPADYTLRLTFYDMNRPEPEKHPVSMTAPVRVRG